MNWKDGTLQTKSLRIQITNRHIAAKGQWVCHVRELAWSCKRIDIPDEATQHEASTAAVAMVRHHLHTLIAELS